MVPEGWTATQIGDVAKFASGGTPKKKLTKYWGGEEPWISGKDLKTHYLKTSIDTLTDAGFAVAKVAPKDSSLVLVRGMTLLKDFPVGYATRNVAFNQDIKALIPVENVDGLFLSFLLVANKHKVRQLVSTAGHGTGRLDTASLQKFPVNIPPLAEQKKIAQLLSIWDKAITTTEQLLANSKKQKKALMQQLLVGKKRMLDRDGIRFSVEWVKGKLSDIAIIDTGYAFKSNDFTSAASGIPIIRMSDFKTGGIDITGAARVAADATARLDRFKLRVGDFVFGMSGSLSNYAWVQEQDVPCFLNQRVGRILAKEYSVQMFVTYLYLSDKVQLAILDKAAGAAQLNISVSDLKNTTVQYPSFEEQQRIAAVLAAADKEVSSLRQKLEFLKQEKKALMQQLLTGKRRVKVDEEAAA